MTVTAKAANAEARGYGWAFRSVKRDVWCLEVGP